TACNRLSRTHLGPVTAPGYGPFLFSGIAILIPTSSLRITIGATLVVGLVAAAPGQDLSATDVDRAVLEARREWEVPGTAVVIVRGDKVIHLKGYGRRESTGDVPVTADPVFPLAACT